MEQVYLLFLPPKTYKSMYLLKKNCINSCTDDHSVINIKGVPLSNKKTSSTPSVAPTSTCFSNFQLIVLNLCSTTLKFRFSYLTALYKFICQCLLFLHWTQETKEINECRFNYTWISILALNLCFSAWGEQHFVCWWLWNNTAAISINNSYYKSGRAED